MSNIRYILAGILLSIVTLHVGAKPRLKASQLTPDEYHYIAVWGQMAYSTLLSPSTEVLPAPGFSPALGVGYRLHYNHFLMQVGVEGQYSYLTNGIDDKGIEMQMKDTEGEPFKMHAKLADCSDVVQAAFVDVPVLFGLEYGMFYAMAGVTPQVNVWAGTKSSSRLSSTATYDWGIDDFHSMPNHQLVDNKNVSSGPKHMSLNFNLLAHLEAGLRVDKFLWKKGFDVHNHNYRMYLALFAQYGIFNCHKSDAQGSLLSFEQTEDQGLQFYVMPTMVCNELSETPFHNLNAGVKFTCIFDLPKSKKCLFCLDNKPLTQKKGRTKIEKDPFD